MIYLVTQPYDLHQYGDEETIKGIVFYQLKEAKAFVERKKNPLYKILFLLEEHDYDTFQLDRFEE